MTLVLLLTAFPVGAVFAHAAEIIDSGECGENVTWTLDSEGVLTIEGEGDMFNWEDPDGIVSPFCDMGNTISEVNIKNGVTRIGDYSFYGCGSLTSVAFADSVTAIGEDAFYGTAYYNDKTNWIDGVLYIDNALIKADEEAIAENYTIKKGTTVIADKAFIYCTDLTGIMIPDSVTSIGFYAFFYCTDLTDITFPDSVTSVGDYAFYNTDYYNNDKNWVDGVLYFGKALIKADEETLNGSYAIKKGTKVLADGAFFNCNRLTSVNIPNSIIRIGSSAFGNCKNLTSVTVPDSVMSIGSAAFVGCSNMTSVTIPNGVRSIGRAMFGECSKLTSFTVPDSVTGICDFAFYSCRNLKTVAIGKNVTSIGESAFYDCRSLTSVTIPDSVINIGECAFSDCAGLTSATLGDNVISVGESAFSDCSSLRSVAIGDKVTSIGDAAFFNCNRLKKVIYSGSKDDWDEIEIGKENDDLIGAKMQYLRVASETTETPSVTAAPTTNEPPTETESLTATDPPTTTDVPIVTDAPTGTEAPTSTEVTTATKPATTTEPTTTTEPPTATETPAITEPVKAIESKDAEKAIVNAEKKQVAIRPGQSPDELKDLLGGNVMILGADGKALDAGKKVGTGCIVKTPDGAEYTIVIPGDTDGDGKVGASDARKALRASAKLDLLDGAYGRAADINADGKIKAADARSILRIAAKLDEITKDILSKM